MSVAVLAERQRTWARPKRGGPRSQPETVLREGTATFSAYGGFAFAKEYDIGRKRREVRLYRTAPISTNLMLAYIGQHVLGMPRSY